MSCAEAKKMRDSLKTDFRPNRKTSKPNRKKETSTAKDDLPAGWVRYWDGDRAYYHHEDHGSQWSRPSVGLPDGWSAHDSPDGRTYYHHEEFGSRWQRPT